MRCGPLPRFLLLLSDTYFPSDEWRVSSTYSLLVKLCFAFYNDSTSCRYYNTLCFCLDFLFLHLPKKYNCSLSHFSSFCLLSSTFGQRFFFFCSSQHSLNISLRPSLIYSMYMLYLCFSHTRTHTCKRNAQFFLAFLYCARTGRDAALASLLFHTLMQYLCKVKGAHLCFFLKSFCLSSK